MRHPDNRKADKSKERRSRKDRVTYLGSFLSKESVTNPMTIGERAECEAGTQSEQEWASCLGFSNSRHFVFAFEYDKPNRNCVAKID